MHIQNIFKDGELDFSTAEKSSVVQTEGKRNVKRSINKMLKKRLISLFLYNARIIHKFFGLKAKKTKNRGEEIQIQATVKLPLNSDREIGNLKEIKDFNHKYVVTTSRNDVQTIDSIKVMHIVDFLLLENF